MNDFVTLLNFIKYPSITEKSVTLYKDRKYTFIVEKSITKTKIKFVIEKMFNVKIAKVNTCILPIKKRRVGRFIGKRSLYKKAYISLQKGESISELFN